MESALSTRKLSKVRVNLLILIKFQLRNISKKFVNKLWHLKKALGTENTMFEFMF